MTVESSTPETAAATARELHDLMYAIADTVADLGAEHALSLLAARGFTVVSGGEGLQHGDRLTRTWPTAFREHAYPHSPYVEYLDEDGAVAATGNVLAYIASGAAPGTTAEPAEICTRVRVGIGDVGTSELWPLLDGPHELLPGQFYVYRAAGATAPETTQAACPDCEGTKRVRTSWRDPRPSACPSCSGSGVAETSP